MKKLFLLSLCMAISSVSILQGQTTFSYNRISYQGNAGPEDSGGELNPLQAAYDVQHFDLNLAIEPDLREIDGSITIRIDVLSDLDTLLLDLENLLTVDSVYLAIGDGANAAASFIHNAGQIRAVFPQTVAAGEVITATVHYHGVPRVAVNPPWGGGFTWKTTSSGKHWIGVACEEMGADVWYPCKDHSSDEPDSVSLHFTVPNPLICASNGVLKSTVDNGDGTSTFNWFEGSSINNYNVTLYISEYQLIEDKFYSTIGDSIPFVFYVTPERYTDAVNHLPNWRFEFSVLESICGPFPFGHEKLGWAHAPYWGMEHQTIIAYGHNFKTNSWGFDFIHLHELAHEWWGNLVTAKNWNDVWIHEGIGTYMEALFVEQAQGADRFHEYINRTKPDDSHQYPLAPLETWSATPAWNQLNPYSRGAWAVHTLRYHLGDDDFFSVLKHWCYPDTNDTDNTNGRLCRIVTTDDLKNQAETITGVDLDPFFDVFLHEAAFPGLDVVRHRTQTNFTWVTENSVPLDLNVPVTVNGTPMTVEMTAGQGSLAINEGDILVIDPDQWILMADPAVVSDVEESAVPHRFNLEQNYPNPFNPETRISFEIQEKSAVTLSVYDASGRLVRTLIQGEYLPGKYKAVFNSADLTSGIYFYQLKAGRLTEVKKMTLIK